MIKTKAATGGLDITRTWSRRDDMKMFLRNIIREYLGQAHGSPRQLNCMQHLHSKLQWIYV